MDLEERAELLTFEGAEPLQYELDTPATRVAVPPVRGVETPAFYREPPRGHASLWVLAGLGVFTVHLLFGYIWFTHPPPEPAGTTL